MTTYERVSDLFLTTVGSIKIEVPFVVRLIFNDRREYKNRSALCGAK